MSELTKEHFDKVLKTFATKEDTTAIKTGMAKLATAEELATLKQDVATIKKAVSGHTTSLDNLLTKKKTKDQTGSDVKRRLPLIRRKCPGCDERQVTAGHPFPPQQLALGMRIALEGIAPFGFGQRTYLGQDRPHRLDSQYELR